MSSPGLKLAVEMIRGLNHLTLAVTDLARAVGFYRDVLGLKLVMLSASGAYFEAGSLWLCLQADAKAAGRPHPDYTHIAFDVAEADFAALAARIEAAALVWQPNRSEGESLYMLDPDGHRLEVHVGSLASRLAQYRQRQAAGELKGMWLADGVGGAPE